MEHLLDKFKDFFDFVPVMILAILGGVVKLLNTKDGLTFSMFLTGAITSAFVGIVMYYVLKDISISENLKAAMTAISGYMSRDVLVFLSDKLIGFLKKKV